jgi:transcriptional regulator with XRE-family HTH domain
MNFSKQLKKYRELNLLSQEMLAEKIYVTRQTISKWENDRSYPDIHNLVALSILFDISLDELVKGDMIIMKNAIANEKMDKDVKGMLLFMVLGIDNRGSEHYYFWCKRVYSFCHFMGNQYVFCDENRKSEKET